MKTKHAQAYPLVRFVLSAFCLLALLLPLPSYGADTGTVKGKVTDKADGEGVYGASVTVAGTTIGTATDMNGNYTLQGVPAKQQKIAVSIVGYSPASQTVSVGAGQTSVVNLSLGQTTIMASEVVVGAALYKQDRLEVPVTANVVSKQKIEQKPNPTLDQVVEDVPGVVVSRAGGASTSSMQIRGSNTYQGGGIGTRVQGLYDGFPINNPESGEITWQTVNMNAADKVEVLKGAAATLYGSGAMGGVVNVQGHLPDKMEVKAGSSVGFYDAPPSSDQSIYRQENKYPMFWSSYVGIGNKSGKWTYNLLYSHSDDDGYRQNAWNYMNDVKFKARYDIDAKQYLQVSAFYNTMVGGYAYQWAWNTNIVDANYGSFPPSPSITATPTPITNRAYDIYRTYSGHYVGTGFGTIYNPVYDVYTDDLIERKNALIGLNYVNMLSDNLSLDTRLYYTYNSTRYEYNTTDYDQEYPTGGGAFSGFSSPLYPSIKKPGQFNESDDNRYGAGVKLDWRVTPAHRFLFGVDGNIVDTKTTQVAAEYPVSGKFNDIMERNFAAFVQDEWKITEKLTSLASLRYDWSGVDAKEVQLRNGTWQELENESVDALSPRFALNYKATDDMAFRGSWGKSFRAPSLYERFVREGGIFYITPNPSLDKETMTAWELGMYKQFGDKVSFDIAGFINDYDNLIESRLQTDGTYKYLNITKARIWGIETSLNYKPTSNWNLSVGYTYMNAKNKSYNPATASTTEKNNPDPEWLAYRPEHTGSASVTWKPTKQLTLNVNGRYVSKYKAVSLYSNSDGYYYPGDFVVFNLGA
ncbi:MAG: TonB-dependent receptor, partial [Chlorobi bacterium]|nr:TonB-dependent receptor [Chlorobiota bacterium]